MFVPNLVLQFVHTVIRASVLGWGSGMKFCGEGINCVSVALQEAWWMADLIMCGPSVLCEILLRKDMLLKISGYYSVCRRGKNWILASQLYLFFDKIISGTCLCSYIKQLFLPLMIQRSLKFRLYLQNLIWSYQKSKLRESQNH